MKIGWSDTIDVKYRSFENLVILTMGAKDTAQMELLVLGLPRTGTQSK